MPVIVFNKRTGKYLRRHSGSFRYKWSDLKFKDDINKEILKLFGPVLNYKEDRENYRRRQRKIDKYLQDKIFDAPPEEARVYHSESSAIQSVGDWRGPGNTDGAGKCVLPDRFEIHEIKESSVCVMRPDGSSNCDDENAK